MAGLQKSKPSSYQISQNLADHKNRPYQSIVGAGSTINKKLKQKLNDQNPPFSGFDNTLIPTDQ
jgi:hypothetical protein